MYDSAFAPRPLPSSRDRRGLSPDVALFSHLTTEIRDALMRAATVKVFRKGAVLWRRGAKAKFVYIILSGRIGLFDTLIAERSTVIDLFSSGSICGGGFTLSEPPYLYLFSGKALDDLRVLTIPITVYRDYLHKDHALLLGTARQMLDACQRLVVQMRALKQLSADQRLACYLLALTSKKTGTATVQLTDDQLMIASLLGVTRESLSRSFAQLRRRGVSKRGRLVVLTDIKNLRSFCNYNVQWPAIEPTAT
jgi:CRP/FNR family transcriptional regulator, transcriptional activator FtrB